MDKQYAIKGLEKVRKRKYTSIYSNIKKISHWKTQGHDGIHGFRFKKFTSIHNRLVLEINKWLLGANVRDWMTKGKTTLIQKNSLKGTVPNNYLPITCLTMKFEILMAQKREKIYYLLTSH